MTTKFAKDFTPPNEQLIEDPLFALSQGQIKIEKTYRHFNGNPIPLSDRLPGPGNHPGYYQDWGCSPDEYFECDRCKRTVPNWSACEDDLPDTCEDCWAEEHKDEGWDFTL